MVAADMRPRYKARRPLLCCGLRRSPRRVRRNRQRFGRAADGIGESVGFRHSRVNSRLLCV
jgi:hypothetical protein